jgi:hypothetical protein
MNSLRSALTGRLASQKNNRYPGKENIRYELTKLQMT